MEISQLQTLLNTLVKCNVTYYRDSNVELRLGVTRQEAEATEEPEKESPEVARIREMVGKLPDNYQQLLP